MIMLEVMDDGLWYDSAVRKWSNISITNRRYNVDNYSINHNIGNAYFKH